MRSTHHCLELDGPGPSGFNERIHKKQVLPYLGSSQNYLFPWVSSEPNFNPPSIFGILVVKGSFLKNVLKSKEDTVLLNHLTRKISTGIIQKGSPVSYNIHPGFTFPNYHQIYGPTIISRHQLHVHTCITVDSVLAQPFVTQLQQNG